MKIDPDANEYRSTRLVCAKLYEGGLLSCYLIINSIKKRPFFGRSPEFELNMDLIARHAEKAFQYHLNYALAEVGLALLALVFSYINTIFSGLFVAAGIILICWKSLYQNRNIALNNFSNKLFNPAYNLDGLLAQYNLVETNFDIKQNVITFGGYLPFLGAGIRAWNWNFLIDTSKPAKKPGDQVDSPEELTIEELYNETIKGIRKKDLPNISCEYILFADGNEIEKSELLLPKRVGEPVDNLDPEVLVNEGHKNIYNDWRTYICLKYHDKIRSTLFSTFLRFSRVGKDIFAECSFYILTPINENKYNIDKLARFDDLRIIKIAGMTILYLVVAMILMSSRIFSWAPPLILLFIAAYPLFMIYMDRLKDFLGNRQLRKKIERGEPHNYGRYSSFREMIASPNYKNYFSAQDIIMIRYSIEQTIIYSVADLLDSKGIDSSLLRKDMVAYINQGIMMFGGKLEADQIAAGKGAQAMMQIKDQAQKLFSVHSEVTK